MRVFFTLWRKELASYLLSPAAYVVAVLVLAVTGVGCWLQALLFRGGVARLDELLFWLPTLWIMVLIVVTVLTMRSIAEEKRSGTIETLMTAPVTEVQVVLAKYASALALAVLIFAPTLLYPFVLCRFSSGLGPLDRGILIGGYAGLLLIGAFYIAVGVLMSALTRSLVIAAISSFAILCLIFLLLGAVSHVSSGQYVPVLHDLSAFRHISEFSRGVIDTRPVVLYLSGTWLALFAAVKVLESRRWL